MRTILFTLLITSLAVSAPVPKADPKSKTDVSTAEFIRKTLDGKVSFDFNAGSNLPTVLATLSEDHRINLVLDKSAVANMGFDPSEMMVEVKLKDVKFRNGLRTILNQHNLSYVVLGDTVLVTTEEQAVYKQLKQRVSVDYENVPLSKAIKDLSQNHGVNVVIDPRAVKNKAADTPITLNVDDVPFEAVVRLMCEMASLKPARMGNVIFITTEDRADKLKDSDYLVPNPNNPNGVFPNGPNPPALGIQIQPQAIPEKAERNIEEK